MTVASNTDTKDTLRPPSQSSMPAFSAAAGEAYGQNDEQLAEESKAPVKLEVVDGVRLYMILVALGMGCFLVMLDLTIVSTAIPKITDQFHSVRSVGWYTTSYQLGSTALQLLTGKMYAHFNLKWTFVTLFTIFEIGTALSGAAQSSSMLIISRAIAGIGAAGILNGGLTILAATVPLQRRPATMGAILGFSQLGIVIGPLLGGAFTTNVSWRWCFYINLPLGGFVYIPLLLLHVPNQVEKPPFLLVLRRAHHYFDLVGLALFAPAMVMLLLAMELAANKTYAWSSSQVIGLFVGAGVATIVWLVWNARQGRDALLPIPIVRKHEILFCGLNYMMLGVCITGSAFFMPLFFQAALGVSPITSGVYMLATILPQVAASVISGPLMQRIGYVPILASIAATLYSLGTGLLLLLDPATPKGHWVGFMIIFGFGRGLGFQLPFLAAQYNVSVDDLSSAMAFLVWCQYLGPSIFLTIANIIFDAKVVSTLKTLVPTVNPELILAAGATGFRKIAAPSDVPDIVLAYSRGVHNVFYLLLTTSLVGFLTSWGMGWKNVRKDKTTVAAESQTKATSDEEAGETQTPPASDAAERSAAEDSRETAAAIRTSEEEKTL